MQFNFSRFISLCITSLIHCLYLETVFSFLTPSLFQHASLLHQSQRKRKREGEQERNSLPERSVIFCDLIVETTSLQRYHILLTRGKLLNGKELHKAGNTKSWGQVKPSWRLPAIIPQVLFIGNQGLFVQYCVSIFLASFVFLLTFFCPSLCSLLVYLNLGGTGR